MLVTAMVGCNKESFSNWTQLAISKGSYGNIGHMQPQVHAVTATEDAGQAVTAIEEIGSHKYRLLQQLRAHAARSKGSYSNIGHRQPQMQAVTATEDIGSHKYRPLQQLRAHAATSKGTYSNIRHRQP